jgi:hypothetical protein
LPGGWIESGLLWFNTHAFSLVTDLNADIDSILYPADADVVAQLIFALVGCFSLSTAQFLIIFYNWLHRSIFGQIFPAVFDCSTGLVPLRPRA